MKRIRGLYMEEGLSGWRRKRKRLVRNRAAENGLATGRIVRILSPVDAYMLACQALEATPASSAVA